MSDILPLFELELLSGDGLIAAFLMVSKFFR